jgi:hypothetical protein
MPGGNRFTRNFRSISRGDGFFDALVFANLIRVKGKNIVGSLSPSVHGRDPSKFFV